MKKIFSILAVATLLMVSCDKGVEVNFNPNEIRVEASMKQTRASATSFEIGDKMGLYAVEYDGDNVAELQVSGNFINNEALVYNGTNWV